MPRFKEKLVNPTQLWLLPPSLNEMVSEDDEVRVLSELMDQLDWSILENSYYDRGTPAYPPNIMTKVLVFAYSKGVRSSRKIEELLKSDVRYMWLAGCLKPDFHTIARFRKEKYALLSKLFVDSVRLSKQMGLVNLNIVAFDGTKIAASASRKSLYDAKRVDKDLEAVEAILREADDVDAQEDAQLGDKNGFEVPEHLRDATKRKALLKELKAKLKDSGAKTISTSDDDCRMMKTRDGLKHGFNVQTAVDSQNQIIVAMNVTNLPTDHRQLPEMVNKVEENCTIAPVMVLADTGYCDEPTLAALDDNDQESLVCVKPVLNKKDNNLFQSKCFIKDDERDVLLCPAGRDLTFGSENQCGSGRYKTYRAQGCVSCSFRNECVKSGQGNRRVSVSCKERFRHCMIEKLKRPAGKEVYALRQQIVEPVFGQIKEDRNFRRFSLRGFNGAIAEISLVFLTHNMLKCKKYAVSVAVSAINSLIYYLQQGNRLLFEKINGMLQISWSTFNSEAAF